MIEISYVEREYSDGGIPIKRSDPRRGLSDYTIYYIHTSEEMSRRDMAQAGEYITKLLQAADYEDDILKKVARAPVACYAHNRTCIKLILFSSYDDYKVMMALARGRKNLDK